MGEPSENPAPPKKRRRRWLVVAIVVGLISVTGWWNWPRGDMRLVGKWRSRLQDGSRALLTLYSNGTGVSEIPPDFRARFSWRVENEKLICGSPMDGRLESVCMRLAESVQEWTGTLIVFGQNESSIAELTRDRMVLKADDVSGTQTTTFERIPD